MEFTSGNSGHSRDQVVTVASQDGVHRLRRRRLIIACAAVALAPLLDWAWPGMPWPLAALAAAVILLACAVALRRRR